MTLPHPPPGTRTRRRNVLLLVPLLVAGVALAAYVTPGTASHPSALREDEGFADPLPRPFTALPANETVRFPRDVAVGPDGDLWVTDRTATVHRLAPDGRLLDSFPLPVQDCGNPQGLSVDSEGRILVADTHSSRVLVLSPSGEVRLSFGRYGRKPGEFIYPTAVIQDRAGRFWVSEYGGNDRIQVFSPSGEVLWAFGGPGEAPGRFRRPAGLSWGPEGRLYVADSCNHRVQVFEGEGTFSRVIGRLGDAPGRFRYPFDVAWSSRGTLLVVEYGNSRVQEMTSDGACLGVVGGPGSAPGRLRNPWGIGAGPAGAVIADTGNSRLQRWTFEDLWGDRPRPGP